jgi:hypothetical protein
MPLPLAAAAIGGQVLGGLMGSQGARDAMQAQMRMFREGQNANQGNYLTQLGMNEPWRAGGASALNQLLAMFGLPTQAYTSGVDLAQQNMANSAAANNRLGADAIIKLMKQGRSIKEISQLGVLKTKSGITNRLAKKGLSADQISMLQRGPMGQQPSAQAATAPNVNPAGTAPPGYNFFREEGQRDIGNSFAARGGAFSGNALRGLTEFNQEYANQKMISPLMQLAGFGPQANSNNQQAGSQFGNASAYNYNNMGDARASGIGNQANIWGNALGGIGNIAGYYYGNRQPTGQQAYDDYINAGNQGSYWGYGSQQFPGNGGG